MLLFVENSVLILSSEEEHIGYVAILLYFCDKTVEMFIRDKLHTV